MIFNEIYGNYFVTVQKILCKATKHPITNAKLMEIVLDNAFGESMLSIPQKISCDGEWNLLDESSKSILHHTPSIPLTTLQKRWLKTLLNDPRIKLFNPDTTSLDNVEPLYTQDTFIYYDKFDDGDPYDDPRYQDIFHIIMKAIKEKCSIKLTYPTRKPNNNQCFICHPTRLEYSMRDDKFRLIAFRDNDICTYNICKILDIELLDSTSVADVRYNKENIHHKKSITINLLDKKNTLERVMHQFSFYEKTVRKLDDNEALYELSIQYEAEDETDVLIKIMSFGSTIRVIEPEAFIIQIKERLLKQKGCEI